MPKNLSNRALANRVRRGIGVPNKNEGNDGDLVVRRTSSGDILYLKNGGRWSVIGKLEQIMSKGDSLDKQLKLIGRSSKILTMTASRLTVNQDYIISTGGHQLLLDVDNKDTITTTNRGLYIDYDHIGICASGQTIINRGLQVGVTSSSPTMVGTVVNYGIYANTVGGTSGVQTGYGIYNTVTGHDTNYGLYSLVTDGHPDIKMVSSANISDYCTISVGAEGATTIATVDADTAVAHLTLDVAGNIYYNADGGYHFFQDGSDLRASIGTSKLILQESSAGVGGDNFFIEVTDSNGATTIATYDILGNQADMTIQADGWMELTSHTDHDITLDAGGDINLSADGDQIRFHDGQATYRFVFHLDSTPVLNVTGDFILDGSGDIELNADGGQVTINDDTASHFLFDCDATTFTIYDDTDAADLFSIVVGASGATTISTVDDGAAVGHLTLQPDGDLVLDPVSQKIIINETDKLYFDGGGDTHIGSPSADAFVISVGDETMLQMSEGATGATVLFKESCAGFAQTTTSFADPIVVDFRFSNKAKVTMTGDVTHFYFKFPNMSGNFLLVVVQDGTGGWNNSGQWRAQDSAGNASDGNSGLVAWGGGTAPSLTETADKADILSFYWDNDNEIAYGTFTENF